MKLLLCLAGLLACCMPRASGELLAWLDFGPTIPGESSDPGHSGWAEASGFRVEHKDALTLTCFRPIDKASPRLMLHCCDGTVFDEVKLDVALVEGGTPVEFWQVVFKNVEILGYAQVAAAPGEAPGDEVTFKWTSLVSTYHVIPDGQTSYPITTIVSKDSDGDGLPDAYEEAVGLEAGTSNIGADTDGDGLLDTDEYRLGTNPTDPTSFFRVVATVDAPDSLELTWPSVAGESYSIDFSPDLVTPFDLVEAVTATGAETSRTVSRAPPAGFFRVRKTLP